MLQTGVVILILECEDELHVCEGSTRGLSGKGTFIKYSKF